MSKNEDKSPVVIEEIKINDSETHDSFAYEPKHRIRCIENMKEGLTLSSHRIKIRNAESLLCVKMVKDVCVFFLLQP